jgi:hypothetical protein
LRSSNRTTSVLGRVRLPFHRPTRNEAAPYEIDLPVCRTKTRSSRVSSFH